MLPPASSFPIPFSPMPPSQNLTFPPSFHHQLYSGASSLDSINSTLDFSTHHPRFKHTAGLGMPPNPTRSNSGSNHPSWYGSAENGGTSSPRVDGCGVQNTFTNSYPTNPNSKTCINTNYSNDKFPNTSMMDSGSFTMHSGFPDMFADPNPMDSGNHRMKTDAGRYHPMNPLNYSSANSGFGYPGDYSYNPGTPLFPNYSGVGSVQGITPTNSPLPGSDSSKPVDIGIPQFRTDSPMNSSSVPSRMESLHLLHSPASSPISAPNRSFVMSVDNQNFMNASFPSIMGCFQLNQSPANSPLSAPDQSFMIPAIGTQNFVSGSSLASESFTTPQYPGQSTSHPPRSNTDPQQSQIMPGFGADCWTLPALITPPSFVLNASDTHDYFQKVKGDARIEYGYGLGSPETRKIDAKNDLFALVNNFC